MIYYPVPQDRLPVYEGQYDVCPVSDRAAQEVLSLPIWPELGAETITNIVTKLRQGFLSC
jgi:dTDP-4-amino-4,6-dideoxygalactose transaminase